MYGLLLELHGLTLAACSYVLLVVERVAMLTQPSQGCWRSVLVYKCKNMHKCYASKLPPVNGIIDNTVVSRLYLNKGKRPVHQLMIVLEHEVLWTHLQGGHIGVLGKGARWRMKQSGRRGERREGRVGESRGMGKREN